MKHRKRLTRKQKEIVEKARLNPENWLRTKLLPNELHIVHRESGKERVLRLAG